MTFIEAKDQIADNYIAEHNIQDTGGFPLFGWEQLRYDLIYIGRSVLLKPLWYEAFELYQKSK